ncbi:MAG TPA: class I SAM-dependent methyltransferase [Candidatus Paceibacterota bacterium]|nr:class I SAM-dependent methyltransferase [Candidatus Paceibacterota bacterium]
MSVHKKRVDLTAGSYQGYELLDSGEGMKLERYGEYMLARPDPQAVWYKRLPEEVWVRADGFFGTGWKLKEGMRDSWSAQIGGLNITVRPSAFKHTGVFPEHAETWKFVRSALAGKTDGEKKPEVLNLFGYTGAATVAAASVGASVCHVDASKPAIEHAKENAALAGLSKAPIRWLVDDAMAFVGKEIRRENKYEGIIMDPPSFGRGPKGEVWKIEDHLLPLIESCMKLLSDTPLFFIVNGYAAGYAPEAYAQAVESVLEKSFPNLLSKVSALEYGSMNIMESPKDGRILPAGIYTRLSFK